MASYPTAPKTFTTKSSDADIEASHVNDLQDEVTAVESALLTSLQHDLLFTDATYDIGKSGATRPRDGFFSRDLTIGRNATIVGTLGVTDDVTLAGALSVGGTLGVTGTLTPTGGFVMAAKTYTPTWSGITVGNGTSVGQYFEFGDLVLIHLSFTFGSTSAVTGAISVSLPKTADGFGIIGTALASDSSSSNKYAGAIYPSSTTTTQPITLAAPAVGYSSTVPFTWGSGDTIRITGYYVKGS